MDAHQFFTSSRVLIVAGKGGVGKSTVAGAMALASARAGLRTLHIDLETSATSVPTHELLSHTTIGPGRALADYLSARGMGIISRQLSNSGIIELVASTAPGIDDLLVLGKIKSLTKDPSHDVIIVDGPAAGHALDLLRAPTELRKAVAGGPIRQQADDVLSMLADDAQCRLVLVTTPAMTPVTETLEAAGAMVHDVGVTIGAVVLNMCDEPPPPIDVSGLDDELRAAYGYAAERADSQRSAATMLSTTAPTSEAFGFTVPRFRLEGPSLIDAVSDALDSGFDAGGNPG